MKVHELIQILSKFPQDVEVVLCDYKRMGYEASGDPSAEGLYYDFEIDIDDEMFFSYEDEEQETPIPTLVISFETDYEEKAIELRELENQLKLKEEK